MDAKELSSIFNTKKINHNIHLDLKKEQILACLSLQKGRNCVCFLPTGFGKSLIFVANTVIQQRPTITLIISPLLSLMDNQVKTLKNWNFSCGHIASDTSAHEAQEIAQGNYSFVLASPESVLKPRWRTIFLNPVWQQRISCVVFDEAHCISEWGEDFRPDFREMGQLRSFFKVPVLALTATSTAAVKRDIMSVLQLSESDTDIVARSADRPNIFLEFRKKNHKEYEKELHWLIDYLRSNGKKSKKMILYCRSIDTVSDIFITMKDSLGKSAYIDGIERSANLIVEMYHKCTDESSKKRILDQFSSASSNIRCLIATVALGMGLDIKDIDIVIHIGCPKSVISFWQEAGRCARDGRQGFSFVLFDNFTASLKSTDKSMAQIVRNADGKCIRKMILEYFSVSDQETLEYKSCTGCESEQCKCSHCSCCSICARQCPCNKDDSYIMNFLSRD